jgi:Icc-related predicted phosphoesterase
MTRVLAVADEVSESLEDGLLLELRPDLILGCGDLPFEYLEYLVSRSNVPVLYVPGNHDPALKPSDPLWSGATARGVGVGAQGCISVDGRIESVAGMRIAGLGGSIRYREGPNQYTQAQMTRRALALELRVRLSRRRVDVLITHSPPLGHHDSDDPAHIGFTGINRLVKRLQPRFLLHGHVLQYGPKAAEERIGTTLIVNAIPYRLLEM